MKRLLRSVIEFDKELSPEYLRQNFNKLRKAVGTGSILWGRDDDQAIFDLVETFYLQYFELPSATTVTDYFKDLNRIDIVERVEDIRIEQPYARMNYVELLRNLQEDQAKTKAFQVLKEGYDILSKGLTIEAGETLKGVDDATNYVTAKLRDLKVSDDEAQILGDIRQDGKTLREEYERAEMDQGRVIGAISGIRIMDAATRGAKRGELWLHAAFPGELKTMLACNWCYNACTRFKKNVVYVSFEMTREQLRRSILAQHSASARFRAQGFAPLSYSKIRDGQLSPEEKAFYFEHVIPDFESNPTYTTFEVVTPDRAWNMGDVNAAITQLHNEFEVGLVILDHGQWIDAKKKHRDYTVELNSVITDAKRFALNFDNNNGVPVVMLFQINRTGKTEADKNEGVYKMNALTYANNAEKTADVITTTYLNDELRGQNTTVFSNLKNRDNPLFRPFKATILWECRKILGEVPEEAPGLQISKADEYYALMP